MMTSADVTAVLDALIARSCPLPNPETESGWARLGHKDLESMTDAELRRESRRAQLAIDLSEGAGEPWLKERIAAIDKEVGLRW